MRPLGIIKNLYSDDKKNIWHQNFQLAILQAVKRNKCKRQNKYSSDKYSQVVRILKREDLTACILERKQLIKREFIYAAFTYTDHTQQNGGTLLDEGNSNNSKR